MTNAIAIKQLVQSSKASLIEALPPTLANQGDRFIKVLQTAALNTYNLPKAISTPDGKRTFLTSAQKCIQDGLLPDGREAAFVCYGNNVQYMPMIAGIIKKMRNSGDVAGVSAHVIYENDHFEYVLGTTEYIEHKPPRLGDDRGKAIGAYAVIRLKEGDPIIEVMDVAEIEKVRKVSKASGKGPWVDWWDQMAEKTVLRRAAKRAPSSADLMSVLTADDAHYNLDKKPEPKADQGYDANSLLTDNVQDAEIIEPEKDGKGFDPEDEL